MVTKARLYFEVTPPSKRSTRWELENATRYALESGAKGLDITDSPTGESHSSAVAASMYVKLTYGAGVICHIRTRDLTTMGLKSLVRACSVWDVEDVLLVLGEGEESTGLTPTSAIKTIRSEGVLEGGATRLGLVVDPRRPTNLQRKLEAKPDFLYAAPVASAAEAEFLAGLASKSGSELYAGVFVNSPKNRAIMTRIGINQNSDGSVDWGVVDTLKTISSVLIVMSPADLDAGLSVLRQVAQRVA